MIVSDSAEGSLTQIDSTALAASLSRRFKFRQAIRTDVGLKREENQDAYGYAHTSRVSIYIVADGMGGARGGATASALAVDSILRGAIDENGDITEESLRKAITAANALIFEHSREDESLMGMGTTLVAVAFSGERAILGHVGDSRIYHLRNGEVKQLTKDHTLVQELVDSGSITPEEAIHHPISHMLTRSLGPSEEIEIDSLVLPDTIQPKERFMLCCDGLYNLIPQEEIAEILKSLDPEAAVQRFLSLVLERGAPDNVTVEVIEVHDLDDSTVPFDLPEEGKIRVVTSGSFEGDQLNGQHRARSDKGAQSLSDGVIVERDDVEEYPQESISLGTSPDEYGEDEGALRQEPLPKLFKWVASGFTIIMLMVFLYAFADYYQEKHGKAAVRAAVSSAQGEGPEGGKDAEKPQAAQGGWTKAEIIPPATVQQGELVPPTIDDLPSELPSEAQGAAQGLVAARLQALEASEAIIDRKVQLREQVADLDAKLWLLDVSSPERLKKRRAELDAQIKTAQKGLTQTTEAIEAGKKEVALWQERRKGFIPQEVMTYAEDLSPLDEEVQRRKDDYHLTQVRFREVVSLFEADPMNPDALTAMDTARKELNNQRAVLEQAVREGIDRGIQNGTVRLADRMLQQLELKRHVDRLNRHLALVDGARPKELSKDKSKDGGAKDSLQEILSADTEAQKSLLKERAELSEQLYKLRGQLSDQEELSFRRSQIVEGIQDSPL